MNRSLFQSAQLQNAPSGIAQQLRKTSDIHDQGVDAMNIDDFIFADEGAASVNDNSPQPPAASSLSGPQTAAIRKNKSSKALASAIPIKGRKGSSANQFVAQSVPVPPHHQRGHNDEFHYVPRHDRKTSIDDRRVSAFHQNKPSIPPFLTTLHLILLWRACIFLVIFVFLFLVLFYLALFGLLPSISLPIIVYFYFPFPFFSNTTYNSILLHVVDCLTYND
jgi:hypothetical protein